MNRYSGPTNLVVLVTDVELFHELSVESTWSDTGGRYERFANYDSTRTLMRLAQATRAIYLDLPIFGPAHDAASGA